MLENVSLRSSVCLNKLESHKIFRSQNHFTVNGKIKTKKSCKKIFKNKNQEKHFHSNIELPFSIHLISKDQRQIISNNKSIYMKIRHIKLSENKKSQISKSINFSAAIISKQNKNFTSKASKFKLSKDYFQNKDTFISIPENPILFVQEP